MTRTNPDKLSVEYPVVKFIKKRMKRSDDFSEDQVKGFDRRVRDHALMRFIIGYTQELYDKVADDKGETRETRRLAMIITGHLNTIENQEKQIAELKQKLEEQELELSTRRAYD